MIRILLDIIDEHLVQDILAGCNLHCAQRGEHLGQDEVDYLDYIFL